MAAAFRERDLEGAFFGYRISTTVILRHTTRVARIVRLAVPPEHKGAWQPPVTTCADRAGPVPRALAIWITGFVSAQPCRNIRIRRQRVALSPPRSYGETRGRFRSVRDR